MLKGISPPPPSAISRRSRTTNWGMTCAHPFADASVEDVEHAPDAHVQNVRGLRIKELRPVHERQVAHGVHAADGPPDDFRVADVPPNDFRVPARVAEALDRAAGAVVEY